MDTCNDKRSCTPKSDNMEGNIKKSLQAKSSGTIDNLKKSHYPTANGDVKVQVPSKSVNILNSNVNTVGLSKKERRALKISQRANDSLNIPCKESFINKQDADKIVNFQETNLNLQKVPIVVKDKSSAIVTSKIISTEEFTTIQTENIASEKRDQKVDGACSKAQLRAERRALQEQQRLAKSALKTAPKCVPKSQDSVVMTSARKLIEVPPECVPDHQMYLFNHLYIKRAFTDQFIKAEPRVHSAFIHLGAQYASKTILGSNARCIALLFALKRLVYDFNTPPKQEFCRSLESVVQKCEAYVQACRPFAVSMTNALRQFKLFLTQVNDNLSDDDKRAELLSSIDVYRQEQILTAAKAISIKVNEKITDDDIILTYGCSSLIRRLLLDAHLEGKEFKVIVVDSRPLLEGLEMLRTLTDQGIECTYMLINTVSHIMNKVTKVLLSAHALLANGYVMSRIGTAQVALIAQAHNKPVLVCCETYKFCERAQTDCFSHNEIGDPDQLTSVGVINQDNQLDKWRNSKYLTPLNLLYDITPPDFVTAVVTELGILPCTSVPVVLRIKPLD